jgi:hypothetical protein
VVAVLEGDQRAEIGGGVVDGTDHDLGHELGDAADERVVEGALHVGAGGGGAVLAGVDQRPGDGAAGGGLEVGVVEDDEGGLAAQLEVHPLDQARGQ